MATFVRTQNVEHRIGARGRFSLKTTAGNVRLRGTDEDVARVRANFEIRAASEDDASRVFDEIEFVVEQTDDGLAMSPPDDRGSLGSALARLLQPRSGADVSVEVDLPRGARLALEVVSADIQATGLIGEQRYTSVSGDLYLTELGGQVRVSTVSGDATIRADTAASIRAEAVSGDVSVIAPLFEGLRANTVSGDIELDGQLATDGDFRAETVSGDLTVRLAGDASFEVRGISTDISSDLDHRVEGRADRRRLIVGGGEPRFVFSSMSGDLSIVRSSRTVAAADAPPKVAMAPLDELAILQALERGDIDVDEASRRLAGGR
jgi:hypothetical protein